MKKSLDICVAKIQRGQDSNGSMTGSGWAGVLQSSFAMNALEAAQAKGAGVDQHALDRARAFQKNNYNSKTGDVNTELGAGVMLYSVSGSTRASAKENVPGRFIWIPASRSSLGRCSPSPRKACPAAAISVTWRVSLSRPPRLIRSSPGSSCARSP